MLRELFNDVWDYTMEHQWANTLSHCVLALVYSLLVASVFYLICHWTIGMPFWFAWVCGSIVSFFAYLHSEIQDLLTDWSGGFKIDWSDHAWDLVGPLGVMLGVIRLYW